ncbi:type II secretion system F family protein [Microvirga massiliensis]|uniref:type II secretion system F family protein n=1 Tax=Microvirga massiliensis TaxID=1033741 RepID=UPI00062BC688|nr:type II secretion system F family protein [Microvirga massiliensis]
MIFDFNPLYVFYIAAALTGVLAAEGFYLLVSNTRDYRSRVNRRLEISGKGESREKVLVQLRRERGLSADGDSLFGVAWFSRLVVQSGVKISLPRAILMIAGAGLACAFAAFMAKRDPVIALAAGGAGAVLLPLGLLIVKRNKRQGEFGAKFPDAIDIIVRSLRAGHPVPIAIGMVARELPDPVGTEFGMVADEITYGADIETALRNMMHRVGQEDLPLFVTSVAIQSTTGGNLSQILENLAKVIRERFKMRRKIRGLSAEGRAGAMILNLTPFAVFALVNFVSPDFYGYVWDRPSTTVVLGGALFWMFVGNLIMRRMVNFKF